VDRLNQICFRTRLTSKYTFEEPRVLKHEELVPKPYWRFYKKKLNP
jgi:hypothetical protein